MADSELRKYAVQKPKGKSWETLALVPDLSTGRAEFAEAVGQYGKGYVRLIQVDFRSAEALSDYDWHLIELHDPFKGQGGRQRPTVIAGSERAKPEPAKGKGKPPPRTPGRPVPGPVSAGGGAVGGGFGPGSTARDLRSRPLPGSRPPEQVPIPYATYIAAALFGALAVALWLLWFRV